MNRHSTASYLIIVSIFVLALKDSASFVHTLLHYIPNPWHQHEAIIKHVPLNPLEIHKYLERKHGHDHTHGSHMHVHDVMDHMHSAAPSTDSNSSSEEIKTDIKIDFYFQSDPDFILRQKEADQHVPAFSIYAFSLVTSGVCPPHQPPRL